MKFLCISFFSVAFACFFSGADVPGVLQQEMDRLDADSVLAHGQWGFCVMTADSGKILAAHNSQLSLSPASTLKILTTGAALGLLGENFMYKTTIGYDGTFDKNSGVIHGNLFICGSGDPTLASKYYAMNGEMIALLHAYPDKIAAMGVKKIEGDVIGDASCFSDNPVPDDWTWSDIGEYYGAGACGLAYQDNSVSLYFNSANGDSCSLVKVDPSPDGVIYQANVKADAKKDEALVYGAPFGNIFYVNGSIPAGRTLYEVDAANPDPAYQYAKDFYSALKKAGVNISGNPTTARRNDLAGKKYSGTRTVLQTITSPPLSDIVYQTNLNSDNIYAEQLLRTLGKLKKNCGCEDSGIAVVKHFWDSLGVNTDGLFMTDGCGLSRSNGITTLIEASVLQKISGQKWFAAFDKSLPVAAKSGSMTGLCRGTRAANNMHAKTGYITRVRAYAGYVKSKSGKLLCFSLIVNNYSCTPQDMKKKMEKLLVALAEVE